MSDTVCSLPYINRIKDNILDINEPGIRDLYADLQTCDVIIPVATGRSRHCMYIPMSQLGVMENHKTVIIPEGVGFPWGSMKEAAPNLEKRYNSKKILMLVVSGTGESVDPKTAALELDEYIERTKTETFKIAAITSNPKSTIGKIARKHGTLLQLKGRTKEPRRIGEEFRYIETGIMRDQFELGEGLVLTIMADLYYEGLSSELFYERATEELMYLGKLIDENLDSEFINKSIDVLETRCHVFKATKGPSDEVARTALIRLAHVKRAVGDEVYISNPPRPRRGDYQLSVSYSGSGIIVDWAKTFRSLGGYQFSIVGQPNSDLSRISDVTLVIREEITEGRPRKFYNRAAWLLSPLVIKLIDRYREHGIRLPPEILDYHHSVTE